MMLFGIATMTFLTSCDPTDDGNSEPILVVDPDGTISAVENSVVTVEVYASQNSTTTKKLESLEVDADGTASDTLIEFPNNTASQNFTFSFVAPLAGQQDNVTFILTDKDGKTNSVTLTINGTSSVTTTPLGAATSFSMVRCGSNNDPEMFGLKFDLVNGSSPNFNAVLVTTTADKLVELTTAQWTSITTKEDLQAAVDGGTASTQFTLALGAAGQVLDKVVATKVGSTYSLIHFDNSDQATCSGGTEWTLEGDYKE